MGGGGQVDPGAASASSQAALQTSNAQSNLANTTADIYKRAYGKLFGNDVSGGVLTEDLNPGNRDVNAPTGVYKDILGTANAQTAQDTGYSRRASLLNAANRGFGLSPMQSAYLDRQSYMQGANTRGQNFINTTMQQKQDMTNRFNNAVNILSGNAATALGGANAGYSGAGQTDTGIYSTAGKQSQGGGILNSALAAGGAMGSAAITCPCSGGIFLVKDGDNWVSKAVQDLDGTEIVLNENKVGIPLDGKPQRVTSECLEVKTHGGLSTRCSITHTFKSPSGAMVVASESIGKTIQTLEGFDVVRELKHIGWLPVFPIKLKGVLGQDETYVVDGFIAFE